MLKTKRCGSDSWKWEGGNSRQRTQRHKQTASLGSSGSRSPVCLRDTVGLRSYFFPLSWGLKLHFVQRRTHWWRLWERRDEILSESSEIFVNTSLLLLTLVRQKMGHSMVDKASSEPCLPAVPASTDPAVLPLPPPSSTAGIPEVLRASQAVLWLNSFCLQYSFFLIPSAFPSTSSGPASLLQSSSNLFFKHLRNQTFWFHHFDCTLTVTSQSRCNLTVNRPQSNSTKNIFVQQMYSDYIQCPNSVVGAGILFKVLGLSVHFVFCFLGFFVCLFWCGAFFGFVLVFWPHHASFRILVPWPGIEPSSPQWKHGVLTSGRPGKSLNLFI